VKAQGLSHIFEPTLVFTVTKPGLPPQGARAPATRSLALLYLLLGLPAEAKSQESKKFTFQRFKKIIIIRNNDPRS
jgi:hypothetical protein